jgi:hypothetical protein
MFIDRSVKLSTNSVRRSGMVAGVVTLYLNPAPELRRMELAHRSINISPLTGLNPQ